MVWIPKSIWDRKRPLQTLGSCDRHFKNQTMVKIFEKDSNSTLTGLLLQLPLNHCLFWGISFLGCQKNRHSKNEWMNEWIDCMLQKLDYVGGKETLPIHVSISCGLVLQVRLCDTLFRLLFLCLWQRESVILWAGVSWPTWTHRDTPFLGHHKPFGRFSGTFWVIFRLRRAVLLASQCLAWMWSDSFAEATSEIIPLLPSALTASVIQGGSCTGSFTC